MKTQCIWIISIGFVLNFGFSFLLAKYVDSCSCILSILPPITFIITLIIFSLISFYIKKQENEQTHAKEIKDQEFRHKKEWEDHQFNLHQQRKENADLNKLIEDNQKLKEQISKQQTEYKLLTAAFSVFKREDDMEKVNKEITQIKNIIENFKL